MELILYSFFKINYQATKTRMAQKAAVSYISDKCKTKINKVTYNKLAVYLYNKSIYCIKNLQMCS